ncbi:MAG TPA: NAD-dependent epimerase/dehydratase family protein [bacterium]
MSLAVVTGSSGLVGSETVKFLAEQGLEVVGIDNNLRRYFFGPDGSTERRTGELQRTLRGFTHHDLDIRDECRISGLFGRLGRATSLVVHAAAQPSHDWAAREPLTDFSVNADGTLVLLDAARRHCPEAVFVLLSTNKVYGDTPNRLPLVEQQLRWELDVAHPFSPHGIDESMSIDCSMHSLFGASKLSADILTQEYGRYFGMRTGTFRCGCVTGPAHAAVEQHGFLAYLVKCALSGRTYTIFGHKGKQVRDNIHARDLVRALWQFFLAPRSAAVYNMGGSRHSNCSILEAIGKIEALCGRRVQTALGEARAGDHVWYISDVRRFRKDYPDWAHAYDLDRILAELTEAARAV